MLNTYILIGHVPVRPLSVGHDFPHDNPIAPHITGRGEFPVLDGFWCSPSDRDLPSLWTWKEQPKQGRWDWNLTVTESWHWREAQITATILIVIQTGRWIEQNPWEESVVHAILLKKEKENQEGKYIWPDRGNRKRVNCLTRNLTYKILKSVYKSQTCSYPLKSTLKLILDRYPPENVNR